jgi:hypothetical protein
MENHGSDSPGQVRLAHNVVRCVWFKSSGLFGMVGKSQRRLGKALGMSRESREVFVDSEIANVLKAYLAGRTTFYS